MTGVLISPRDSNRPLVGALENSDSRCITWPRLCIDAPRDDARLIEAIEHLFGYDWVILKNLRAAHYFLKALQQHSPDPLDSLRVLAVGQTTAEKLAELQNHVDIVLERFATSEIYDAVRRYVGDDESTRLNILVPGANVFREAFEEQFAAAGARVDSVAAYQTTPDLDHLTRLKALLAGEAIDYVVFACADEIDELAAVFDINDLQRVLGAVSVVCLDESIVKAAKLFGLAKVIAPSRPSFEAVTDLIARLQT
ncbi:MAG TPA: uroporphyrinogen-III synthase [Pyrinomonadaceae bacterium]|jgi:uroporphyrinogen-III synthase|nr:uroporphyrinogen-III synthase [Pyrinomonadaceae bacterium]